MSLRSKVIELDEIKITLKDDLWQLELCGIFDFNPGSTDKYYGSMTVPHTGAIKTIVTEREFLFYLINKREILKYISIMHDLTSQRFLEHCECLNQDEIEAILLLEQIDKL